MRVISEAKCELTIKRTDGTVEVVIHPKIDRMNPQLWEHVKRANREAGRGECLSYRNIDAVIESEEEDYKEDCTRCHATVDTRTAYTQKEWTRFGGSKVQVNAYYCHTCHQILGGIGAGEHSELEDRAGHVPSREQAYKGDE